MRNVEDSGGSNRQSGRKRSLNGIEWTEDEVLTLIDSWKRKESFSKIAQKIGRSRKSVTIKACRLGLTARPYWNDQYVANARRCGSSRRCLNCNGIFFSEGPGNRICEQCKNRHSWKSGGDLAGPAV